MYKYAIFHFVKVFVHIYYEWQSIFISFYRIFFQTQFCIIHSLYYLYTKTGIYVNINFTVKCLYFGWAGESLQFHPEHWETMKATPSFKLN